MQFLLRAIFIALLCLNNRHSATSPTIPIDLYRVIIVVNPIIKTHPIKIIVIPVQRHMDMSWNRKYLRFLKVSLIVTPPFIIKLPVYFLPNSIRLTHEQAHE
jgi:hypothetical protein